MRGLFSKVLKPEFFDSAHLHELYNLLKVHFVELNGEEKAATVGAIRGIPAPGWATDPAKALKRIQQQWLSAIAGQGYKEADDWFAKLQKDTGLTVALDHPDFNSYSEIQVGPGVAPYTVAELVAFATAGTVVEKLNEFKEQVTWGGPTTEGLASTLEEAVRTSPQHFVQSLSKFLKAKRRFQYSLILGLKNAWEPVVGQGKEIDWEKLITFFEQLLGDPDFWESQPPEDFYRDSVISAVADCLHSGTRKDDHAYMPSLLPRTQAIIAVLLSKTRGVDQPADDAMTRAINTPKGRVVEGLFSQALRACRLSDQAAGTHQEAWEQIRPLFQAELDKCRGANYEFSTLAGNYLPQLDFMGHEWLQSHVDLIFPEKYPANSICAVDGLAYAALARPVYSLIAERGILDRALQYDLKGRDARDKLLERIAAAYLWGDESLESSRFTFMFSSGLSEDLDTVARFFWMIRGQALSQDQKERILIFFRKCVVWAHGQPKQPSKLLASLGMLSSYLTNADGSSRELLEAVAPYVYVSRSEYTFIEELARLAEVSPEGVSIALGKMIAVRAPDFDYKDQLKGLLRTLVDKGRRRDVLSFAETLRHLTGMQELFDGLTRDK